MPINKDTLYFFRLIRSGAGLGAAPVSDTADTAVTPGSWERIYRMAADHGLSAVVWDGICRLPAAQQPPRETRIRWALSAEKLEERYRHQQQTASKLAARFSEEGLRMLLLKGLGLSRDYPLPEHRECGDIDIYLYGQSDKGDRVLHEGDIVSVDVGARYRGFNGDCAGTFPCGKCSDEALRLIRITRQSFFEGIQFARVGYRISDIGHAVQEYAESYGYSLVREYVGHGVGASLHEAPEIPNYGKPGHGPRLQKNMTIAVEPMVNVGGYEVRTLDNGWTVVTADGSLSAHYENSLLVTDGEPEILTFADDI